MALDHRPHVTMDDGADLVTAMTFISLDWLNKFDPEKQKPVRDWAEKFTPEQRKTLFST